MNFSCWPADTPIAVKRKQYEIIANMTMSRRAELFFEMNDNQRLILAEGVRRRHPDYSEREVNLAVIKLMLGDELFAKVYPNVNVRQL